MADNIGTTGKMLSRLNHPFTTSPADDPHLPLSNRGDETPGRNASKPRVQKTTMPDDSPPTFAPPIDHMKCMPRR
jgi:hypothetical protein